jgi:hypothetical protein
MDCYALWVWSPVALTATLRTDHDVRTSDKNGRKNLISTSTFIYFGGNGIGFGMKTYRFQVKTGSRENGQKKTEQDENVSILISTHLV